MVESGKLSSKKAYKSLYKIRRVKKAKWLKLKINIYDSNLLSKFINIFFILPWPLFLLKRFITRAVTKDNVDLTVLVPLFFSKGTVVLINAEDALINIKIF